MMASFPKQTKMVAIVSVLVVGLVWIGVVSVTPAAGAGEAQYVGSNKCKLCHSKEHKSWAASKMGQALETLKPGVAAEAKTKAGLDSGKDYTTDEACLACHTTGFGEGGYTIETDEKKAKKAVKSFGGVGCEACHGPGSEYCKLHKEIKKAKRNYTWDEMHAAGMTKVEEATCTKCHNDKSPTMTEFKYDPADRTGMHDLQKLKLRKD